MRLTTMAMLLMSVAACERKPTPHFLCRMDRTGTADPLLCRPEPAGGASFKWDQATCEQSTEGLDGAKAHACNRQRIAYCFDPRVKPGQPLEPVCLLNERACAEHRDRLLTTHGNQAATKSPCLKLQPGSVSWAHSKQTWPPPH